jgi:predicted transcriptional regulator YdeE
MKTEPINAFNIIGLSVRTTNENGQAFRDIPALWQKFMSENVAGSIPGKTDTAIYCLYTDYELDHTKPYTVIIGCKTTTLSGTLEGLTVRSFPGGEYIRRTTTPAAIVEEWQKIWAASLPRKFTVDFEVYGHPENAEVDIFIAV